MGLHELSNSAPAVPLTFNFFFKTKIGSKLVACHDMVLVNKHMVMGLSSYPFCN